MLEVAISVIVRDNTAEGSIVSVMHVETVPVNHTDEVAMWMQAKQVLARVARDEVLPKAEIQLEQWQVQAEQRGT